MKIQVAGILMFCCSWR